MIDFNPKSCIIVDASGSYIIKAEELLPNIIRSLNQPDVDIYYTSANRVSKQNFNVHKFKLNALLDGFIFKINKNLSSAGGSGIKIGIERAHEDGYQSLIILTDGFIPVGD